MFDQNEALKDTCWQKGRDMGDSWCVGKPITAFQGDKAVRG